MSVTQGDHAYEAAASSDEGRPAVGTCDQQASTDSLTELEHLVTSRCEARLDSTRADLSAIYVELGQAVTGQGDSRRFRRQVLPRVRMAAEDAASEIDVDLFTPFLFYSDVSIARNDAAQEAVLPVCPTRADAGADAWWSSTGYAREVQCKAWTGSAGDAARRVWKLTRALLKSRNGEVHGVRDRGTRCTELPAGHPNTTDPCAALEDKGAVPALIALAWLWSLDTAAEHVLEPVGTCCRVDCVPACTSVDEVPATACTGSDRPALRGSRRDQLRLRVRRARGARDEVRALLAGLLRWAWVLQLKLTALFLAVQVFRLIVPRPVTPVARLPRLPRGPSSAGLLHVRVGQRGIVSAPSLPPSLLGDSRAHPCLFAGGG